MRKKLFYVVVFVILIVFSGYSIHKSNMTSLNLSNLALANIEALADPDETLKIGCDKYSVVIKCKYMCSSCYTIWTTSDGYGNSTGLSGRCTCGRMY